MKHITNIVIILGLLTSCGNADRITDNSIPAKTLEGSYQVQYEGNIIGAPLIQLDIFRDSTYNFFIIGDCYNRFSHGKIFHSKAELRFQGFVDNPSRFPIILNRDSTQNNNSKCEIIIDSVFDNFKLKWFIVAGEEIIEDKAAPRHFLISDMKPHLNVRLIGIRDVKRFRNSSEREIVCSEGVVIDTCGVYLLTTDTAFAQYPLNYIPYEGNCEKDKYGNISWDRLYLFRQKMLDSFPYSYYYKNLRLQ